MRRGVTVSLRHSRYTFWAIQRCTMRTVSGGEDVGREAELQARGIVADDIAGVDGLVEPRDLPVEVDDRPPERHGEADGGVGPLGGVGALVLVDERAVGRDLIVVGALAPRPVRDGDHTQGRPAPELSRPPYAAASVEKGDAGALELESR